MASLAASDRLSGPFAAVAGQTDFPGLFPLVDEAAAWVVVERAGVATPLAASAFDVRDVSATGFTVRLLSPALAGDVVIVGSDQPAGRDQAYQPGGAVRTAALEHDLTVVTAKLQELRRDWMRTVHAPVGEPGMTLDPRAMRDGKFAFFADGRLTALATLEPFLTLLQQAGYLGTGAAFEVTTEAPGAILDVGVNVGSAWQFPLFRGGVQQVPGLDYVADGAGRLAIVGGFQAGEQFWGYDAGGRFGLGQLAGCTSPEEHGAKGDGVTDDRAALAAAFATGKTVLGDPRRTYAIAGDLVVNGRPRVCAKDLALKQLTPAGATRRSLNVTNCAMVVMSGVRMDRNGTGAEGALSQSAGIWIEGCARVLLDDVEATGDGKGCGIRLVSIPQLHARSLWAHDMTAGLPGDAEAADDVLEGVTVQGCRGVLDAPVVENIKTRWAAQPGGLHRHTRGIAVSGGGVATHTRGLRIVSPTVRYCDQGIDVTGDQVPESVEIVAPEVEYCLLFGIKFANTVRYVSVEGGTIYRCGYCALEFSAASSAIGSDESFEGEDDNTSRAIVTGLKIRGHGYQFGLSGQAVNYAAKIEDNALHPQYPQKIIFRDVVVDDDGEGNMINGFVNQQAATTPASVRPEVQNCKVFGATGLAFSGFDDPTSVLSLSGAQAIPSSGAGPTAVVWTAVVDDRLQLLGSGAPTPTANLVMARGGRMLVEATATFAGAEGGVRSLEVRRNGVLVARGRATVAPLLDSLTPVQTPVEKVVLVDVSPGDTLSVHVQQTSGAPLNLLAGSDTVLRITRAQNWGLA